MRVYFFYFVRAIRLTSCFVYSDTYTRRVEDGKLVATARGERCVGEFGQCGGPMSMRTSACCGPLRCVRKNDWFSECERCVETYGQCGGGEHVGGTCCVKTTDECVEIDEYFSQCQPIAAEGVR